MTEKNRMRGRRNSNDNDDRRYKVRSMKNSNDNDDKRRMTMITEETR